MSKRPVSTLFILIVGIGGWFVLASIPVLIFFNDRIRAELGLLAGAVMAVGMVVHMSAVLEHSTHMEKGSQAFVTAGSIGRMLVVFGILVLTAYTGLINWVTMLIGVFGLKIATFAYPLLTKILQK